MKKLGFRTDVENAFKILKKMNFDGALYYPMLQDNENELVICGLDFGTGEVLYVCNTFRDMQLLYHEYTHGPARKIYWYVGKIKT